MVPPAANGTTEVPACPEAERTAAHLPLGDSATPSTVLPAAGICLPSADNLCSRVTSKFATARNYWPGQLRSVIADNGFEILSTEFSLCQFDRYRWMPEAGEQTIDREEAKAKGRDYLRGEMAERLAAGPAALTLEVVVAGAGDDVDDPTVAWPADRQRIVTGRLDLTAVIDDQDGGCEKEVFDPMRLVKTRFSLRSTSPAFGSIRTSIRSRSQYQPSRTQRAASESGSRLETRPATSSGRCAASKTLTETE